MKVGDLVKDTVSHHDPADAAVAPTLTVILAAGSSSKHSSLLRALDSVTSQPVPALELIVIDDAERGRVPDQIRALVETFPALSYLAHPHSIGLPAVSFFEGFVRAKGRYVLFTSDDFVFESRGLSGLLEAALQGDHPAVHGHVQSFEADGGVTYIGRDETGYDASSRRDLSPAALLLAKSVLDDVGLFDPHVFAADHSAWDLVERILRKYSILRVPVFVGRDYRRSHGSSAGSSAFASRELAREYFKASPDGSLRAGSISEFDVWRVLPGSSPMLTQAVISCRKRFTGAARASEDVGPNAEEIELMLNPQRSTIGLYGDSDASRSSVFDAMPEAQGWRYVFLERSLSETELLHNLARCDVVILVRYLLDDKCRRFVRNCDAMNVPVCYYIDDNPITMSEQHERPDDYKKEAADALRRFVAVLCSSAELARFFKENALHATVEELALACDDQQLEKSRALLARIVAGCDRTNILTWNERMRSAMLVSDVADYHRAAKLEAEMNSRTVRLALALRRGLDALRNVRAAIFGG